MTNFGTRIRLVVVDDSALVREGLRAVLSSHPDAGGIELVGEAGSVTAGIEVVKQLRPDVVLLDIRLPDGTGIEACRRILSAVPHVRILMLTSIVDDSIVLDAIRAGAHGYLLKEIDSRGLLQAIRDVHTGKSILDPAVTARVMQVARSGESGRDAVAALSPQEKRVLALVAEGCTNKEAASRLGLSEKTVKNYLSTAFEKLHVTSRAQAAALYVQQTHRAEGANRP
ncbi:MAG: response regulator transcription factor [Opitutus sp.]|nr:response regulator transcription factor [Opitutus sp.]